MKGIIIGIILMVSGCQSETSKLPILNYKVNDSGKKIQYKITYEDFTNQFGEHFTTENIHGKVLIANFFFTRCPSICPPMRNELIKIGKDFENRKDFLMISHTIDPDNDTVEVLKNYFESTGISGKKWQFIRTSLSKTHEQAGRYMTAFKPNADGSDFFHSSYVSLVDKDQNIRGFYDVLIPDEVIRLKNDIKILLD